uniref:Uncharacterized protein n=1 Tax=uncultured marine virus TaxID=186617 RepID=A0A0F7L570_9VIRU|nr:hypothetical protein [uncultured marine virus]
MDTFFRESSTSRSLFYLFLLLLSRDQRYPVRRAPALFVSQLCRHQEIRSVSVQHSIRCSQCPRAQLLQNHKSITNLLLLVVCHQGFSFSCTAAIAQHGQPLLICRAASIPYPSSAER